MLQRFLKRLELGLRVYIGIKWCVDNPHCVPTKHAAWVGSFIHTAHCRFISVEFPTRDLNHRITRLASQEIKNGDNGTPKIKRMCNREENKNKGIKYAIIIDLDRCQRNERPFAGLWGGDKHPCQSWDLEEINEEQGHLKWVEHIIRVVFHFYFYTASVFGSW